MKFQVVTEMTVRNKTTVSCDVTHSLESQSLWTTP